MKTENGITRLVVAFWLLALLIGCAGAIADAQSTGGAETDTSLMLNETAALAGPYPPPDDNSTAGGSSVQVVVAGTSVNLTAAMSQIPENNVTTPTVTLMSPINDEANGPGLQMKNDSASTTVTLSENNADELLETALEMLSRLMRGNITNIEMEWAALTGETGLTIGPSGL